MLYTIKHVSNLKNFQDGDLKLNWESHEFSFQDVPFRLSPLEYKVLGFLFTNSPRYISTTEILEAIWGENYSPDSVKLYIAFLRKKIGRDRISTLTGFGYRFNCAL